MAWKDISSHNETARQEVHGSSEEELIDRVLAGDRSAFRPLVEAYESAVFGLCSRLLCGQKTDAEDVCQETFLRAYRKLAELKDRRRFAPWLFQIARSLVRDSLRKAHAERRALERRLDLARWEAAGKPVSQDVDEVLSSLPRDERRALELKYFEGLSYRSVAQRMGLSFSQVDHLIRQARTRVASRSLERERSL